MGMSEAYNCIFLVGDRRIGKSTLIRQCISKMMESRGLKLGGFSSQRLLTHDGGIAGFRITDPSDFDVERLYDPELPGIFILHKGGHQYDLSVFSGHAENMLRSSLDSDLILLDEIGGVEMAVPGFRDALYTVLESGIPCIGVLKPAERLAHQAKSEMRLKAAYEESLMLHSILQKNTRFVMPDEIDAVRDEVMSFLKASI